MKSELSPHQIKGEWLQYRESGSTFTYLAYANLFGLDRALEDLILLVVSMYRFTNIIIG